MIVVDSSVLVELLSDRPAGRVAGDRLQSEEIAAPDIVDTEVASALRGLWLGGLLDDEGLLRALDDLAELSITHYASSTLIPRAIELRHILTPYDGAYVALAEALDCTLLTYDHRIRHAPGTRCRIEAP
ncbi:MAG: type II toxin-antitoxin system VapC family toxin [Microbacterium sp.]|uniref:type II toxin-antitoxin system VapC family toxin n=1 Tax=Microbacterium sp. TaxID=51671 RepID=UPI0039E496AC